MAKKIETQVRKNFTPSTSSQSILLEEYRALNGDYIQQRSEGVTRMKYFISAMSFVLAGLVFASGSNVTMNPDFNLVLLAALIILTVIGIDVYSFLIRRNIDIDRDIRGMARIRNYFVNLDPGLEKSFVNGIFNTPGSGMRRSAEIIVGFLVGIAAAILSSYFPLKPVINIVIGVSMITLTALFLELLAQRKLGIAFKRAEKEMMFDKNVNADENTK